MPKNLVKDVCHRGKGGGGNIPTHLTRVICVYDLKKEKDRRGRLDHLTFAVQMGKKRGVIIKERRHQVRLRGGPVVKKKRARRRASARSLSSSP